MSNLEELEGGTTIESALAFYDSLPAVATESMIGAWRGSGLPTENPMDGLLELFGWHGKVFKDLDDVQPLVFEDAKGVFNVNPTLMPLSIVLKLSKGLHDQNVVRFTKPLLRLASTSSPQARLRTIEYRGVATATMSYDALPINDHFRAVGPDTLLGAMDMRGMEQPFMFVLRRETPAEQLPRPTRRRRSDRAGG